MTYIQPNNHQKSTLNFVIAGLILTSLVGVFWLVALYNNIVNLDHTITTEKAAVDSIGAQNTTLNGQVAVALGNVASGDLATADGLVAENHPQYFQQSVTSNQITEWPLASQQ
jgi:hypothetical protein